MARKKKQNTLVPQQPQKQTPETVDSISKNLRNLGSDVNPRSIEEVDALVTPMSGTVHPSCGHVPRSEDGSIAKHYEGISRPIALNFNGKVPIVPAVTVPLTSRAESSSVATLALPTQPIDKQTQQNCSSEIWSGLFKGKLNAKRCSSVLCCSQGSR